MNIECHYVYIGQVVQYAMFNAFEWNCFNLVYTCNIALILFWKYDVTQFRIPPPLVTLRQPPLSPLTCDVIYGWPLIYVIVGIGY